MNFPFRIAIKAAIFSFISVNVAVPALAQEQRLLSADEAVSIALKNNLEIEIAKNNQESARLLNHYGVAGGLPSVTGSAGDIQQIQDIHQKLQNGTEIDRKGAAGNNLSANLTASIVLYNGNRIVATKKRLEQIQLQSQEILNSEIQNLTADVLTAYFDVVRQQTYIKTINQSIAASEKRLEILKVRQSAGMANNADLFQAQIDLNTLNQTLHNQEMIVAIAKTELLRLLSHDARTQLTISDTIVVDPGVSIEETLKKLEANVDIKAAESQIRINDLLRRETMALRYPTVRLNAAYNYTRSQSAAGFNLLNQSQGPNAGLALSIPIFNGSAFKKQQQVAEVSTRSAEHRKNILVRDYTSSAVKTFQSYTTAIKQLETEKKNYLLTQQLLNLTLQRFELIQATIMDVREAQKSFEDAGYRLVNLNFAAKTAEIELKRIGSDL